MVAVSLKTSLEVCDMPSGEKNVQNIYKANSIKIKVANYKDYTTNSYSFILQEFYETSSGIDGVSLSAQSIARLEDLQFSTVRNWGPYGCELRQTSQNQQHPHLARMIQFYRLLYGGSQIGSLRILFFISITIVFF